MLTNLQWLPKGNAAYLKLNSNLVWLSSSRSSGKEILKWKNGSRFISPFSSIMISNGKMPVNSVNIQCQKSHKAERKILFSMVSFQHFPGSSGWCWGSCLTCLCLYFSVNKSYLENKLFYGSLCEHYQFHTFALDAHAKWLSLARSKMMWNQG